MKTRLRRFLLLSGAVVTVGLLGAGFTARRIGYPRPPRVRMGSIRVAAVGDSITWGLGVNLLRRGEESYPSQLGSLLGPDFQVLNYGVSNRTLQDIGNMSYRKTRVSRASLIVEPAIVVVMLGTNDSKPRNWDASSYERQLRDFVDTYQSLPSHPEVLLLTPPAAADSNKAKVQARVIADEIVPIVHRVGRDVGSPVVDVFAATAGHLADFPDGVHPNRIGAKIIATTVQQAIRR